MNFITGDKANPTDDPAMWEAIKEGDLKELRIIFTERLPNPNSPDKEKGDTPLAFAARNRDLALAQLLIEAGAKVQKPSGPVNSTPLHCAAWEGDMEMVELLLGRMTQLKMIYEVNSKNDWGATPLHTAVDRNQPELVKRLLDAGAAIDAQDKQGGTPLHSAILHRKPELVKMLLERGADIYRLDNKERTAKAQAKEGIDYALYEIRNKIDGGEQNKAALEEIMEHLKNARELRAAHVELTAEFNAGSAQDIKVMKALKLTPAAASA